jgi:hypothetical protein
MIVSSRRLARGGKSSFLDLPEVKTERMPFVI